MDDDKKNKAMDDQFNDDVQKDLEAQIEQATGGISEDEAGTEEAVSDDVATNGVEQGDAPDFGTAKEQMN